MPILPPEGKLGPRRPAMTGGAMFDVTQGTERVRVWPRKRGKPKSAATREQNEWFRQMQWATKYMPAPIIEHARRAVAGTPLLYRDILTMIHGNRAFIIITPDGKMIPPMEALNDVSASLDVIGSEVGDQLVRKPEGWRAVKPEPLTSLSAILDRRTPSPELLNDRYSTIPWDAPTFDNGQFVQASFPHGFTVPKTGLYNLTAFAFSSPAAGNGRLMEIWQNGTMIVAVNNAAPNSWPDPRLVLSTLTYAEAGDQFSLQWYPANRTCRVNQGRFTIQTA